MAKKKIVITSRGAKLDMDALKASQPKTKRLVVNQPKEKASAEPPQTVVPNIRKVRVHAVVPAPIPTDKADVLSYVSSNTSVSVSENTTPTTAPTRKHKTRE